MSHRILARSSSSVRLKLLKSAAKSNADALLLDLEDLRDRIPPLPIREVDGVRMLAPAERFEDKKNIENPELYAVYPFRLVSFEKPSPSKWLR